MTNKEKQQHILQIYLPIHLAQRNKRDTRTIDLRSHAEPNIIEICRIHPRRATETDNTPDMHTAHGTLVHAPRGIY